MKFNDYIGIGPEKFQSDYIDTGLVDVAHHDEFPLSLYSYGRKAVHEDVWDKEPLPRTGERRLVFEQEFRKWPEELRPALFALLDKKNVHEVIWNQVKELTKGTQPMVDAHKI
jgi:hypothetical protein